MSIFKTTVFWSNAVTFVYLFLVAAVKVFPNVLWLSEVIVLVNTVLTVVFHKNVTDQLASAKVQLASQKATR